MDSTGSTTELMQLPIWPLVVGTIGLGALSLTVGMAAATALSIVFLFAMSKMPTTATVTVSDSQLTITGWMGALLPIPTTRTLPRQGLDATVQTAAGEDDTFVHVVTFRSGQQILARLAGVQSSPQAVHALANSISLADAAEDQAEAS